MILFSMKYCGWGLICYCTSLDRCRPSNECHRDLRVSWYTLILLQKSDDQQENNFLHLKVILDYKREFNSFRLVPTASYEWLTERRIVESWENLRKAKLGACAERRLPLETEDSLVTRCRQNKPLSHVISEFVCFSRLSSSESAWGAMETIPKTNELLSGKCLNRSALE